MSDALKRWMWAPAVLLVTACGGDPEVDAPSDDPQAMDGPVAGDMPTDPVEFEESNDEIDESADEAASDDPAMDGTDDGEIGPQPAVETAADHPRLKLETVVEGEGDALESGQTARVWYVGFLLDGTQFDGNVGKPEPLTVANVGLAGVIKGWNLGLVGMKKGEKRRLTIPPDLAYGPNPRPKIPANSTLVFDVTLEEIVASEPSKD